MEDEYSFFSELARSSPANRSQCIDNILDFVDILSDLYK